MPGLQSSDANFFALVHHVLESSKQTAAQRREAERHDYCRWQFVAPYRAGRLPTQAEFHLMLCRDLSSAGFSFISDTTPDFEHLVVALGEAPFIFVSAAIKHHKPVQVDGQPKWVVGCEFVARITDAEFGPVLGNREG